MTDKSLIAFTSKNWETYLFDGHYIWFEGFADTPVGALTTKVKITKEGKKITIEETK
jgi:hypothetical protein